MPHASLIMHHPTDTSARPVGVMQSGCDVPDGGGFPDSVLDALAATNAEVSTAFVAAAAAASAVAAAAAAAEAGSNAAA